MAIDLSALSTRQALTAIYIGYYDRAADPAGIQFWEQVVANTSLDLVAITSDFAGQAETQAVHPFFADPTTSSPATFITSLYQNLFNRDPDAAGLTFWSNALQDAIDGVEGAISVGQIITSVIEGAVDDSDAGTFDRTTILNKIEVGVDWTEAAEAADIDYTTNAEAQASAKSIIEGVTEDAATVTAAKATTDAFFDDGGPVTEPGEQYFLTSATDVMTGTDKDDDFMAYIQQNPFAGGVSNSLASSDRLDGGAGYDRLYAEIVNEFVGTSGIVSPDIQPRTTSIEEALFEARELFDSPTIGAGIGGAIDGGGTGGQVVDAKWMFGIERIGSTFSDASLKIENLTTLASDGVTIRNTEDLTIVMDHTENTNSSQSELASDLTVLFDEDYLIAGQTSVGEAQFFLLDQDAELRLKDGNPATTAEGRLDEIDKNGIRFQIGDDTAVVVEFDEALLNELNANEVNSHEAFVAALQADLNAKIAAGLIPSGTTITLEDNNNQIILDDDGLPLNRASLQDGSFSDLIPGIKVTSGDGAVVTPLGFTGPDDIPGEFNVFGRFTNEFETTINPITINVELDKAGRAGQGGDLIIGGKELTDGGDGIAVFNISVEGDSSKPSWITNLNSTNDDLDTINVVTASDVAGSGDVADLTIGEIGGASANNGFDETDVRVFNATGFEGDFTGYANLDEAGNGAHSYMLGGGNDSLTLEFGDTFDGSGDNATFGGAAGDSLTVDTGAGNDTLRLIDGDLTDEDGSSSFTGGADLEFLEIETSAGDDTVWYDTDNRNSGPISDSDTTTGDGASISTSGGDDRIYMSDRNSEFDVSGSGTFESDGYVELDITGIGNANNFQLFEASLQVEFDGVLTEWVDIDYNRSTFRTSRENIRDAIQTAVDNSALAGMIDIVQLADGTLMARSQVSGATNVIAVDIEGPVASLASIDNGDLSSTVGGSDEPPLFGDGETGWDLLNAQPTLNQVSIAQLEDAWLAWYPNSDAFDGGDFSSAGTDFGAPIADANGILVGMDAIADSLDITGNIAGITGNDSDDNVINGGANDDLIVLSENAVSSATTDTENGNGNTVQFTGTFGWDTIVNFTSDGDPTENVSVFDNDVLDFTSYLDMAAHVRGDSVVPQVLRANEAVDYTFVNVMGGDSGATVIDHNQIRLMDFEELWDDLFGAPASSTAPANFDSITATHVDNWLEENMSATGSVVAGSAAGGTGVGNEFLILIGKDGDIEIDTTGAIDFTDDHADNQFWAFMAEVTSFTASPATAGNNYEFSVNFLGGVDLAATDITGLSPDDFGVTLFV